MSTQIELTRTWVEMHPVACRTLADRGWKIRFHWNCAIFRVELLIYQSVALANSREPAETPSFGKKTVLARTLGYPAPKTKRCSWVYMHDELHCSLFFATTLCVLPTLGGWCIMYTIYIYYITQCMRYKICKGHSYCKLYWYIEYYRVIYIYIWIYIYINIHTPNLLRRCRPVESKVKSNFKEQKQTCLDYLRRSSHQPSRAQISPPATPGERKIPGIPWSSRHPVEDSGSECRQSYLKNHKVSQQTTRKQSPSLLACALRLGGGGWAFKPKLPVNPWGFHVYIRRRLYKHSHPQSFTALQTSWVKS